MEFEEAKREYISGEESLKEVAERLGLSYSRLCEASRREGWRRLKMDAKGSARRGKSNADRLQRVTARLLDRLEQAIINMDDEELKNCKHITASLKDIKDIQSVKSEAHAEQVTVRIEGGGRWGE